MGSISQDEFRKALESMHVHLSDQELEEMVAKVDEDGSGEIEFGACIVHPPVLPTCFLHLKLDFRYICNVPDGNSCVCT